MSHVNNSCLFQECGARYSNSFTLTPYPVGRGEAPAGRGEEEGRNYEQG
jgi:hypothetical protein